MGFKVISDLEIFLEFILQKGVNSEIMKKFKKDMKKDIKIIGVIIFFIERPPALRAVSSQEEENF